MCSPSHLVKVLYTGLGLFGAVLGPVVVELRAGRRGAMAVSSFLAGAAALVAAFVFNASPWTAIILLSFTNVCFQTMCTWCVCACTCERGCMCTWVHEHM